VLTITTALISHRETDAAFVGASAGL